MRIVVAIALVATLTAQPTVALAAWRSPDPAANVLVPAMSQPNDQDWTNLDRLRGSVIVVRQKSDKELTGRLTSRSADALVIEVKGGPHTMMKD